MNNMKRKSVIGRSYRIWISLIVAMLVCQAVTFAHGDHHEKSENEKSYRFNITRSDAVLSLLKMDRDTLIQELKQDKSLAEIAQERDVKPKKLIKTIAKERAAMLDQAVAEGKLSAADAKWMKKRQIAGITRKVESKWSELKKGKQEKFEQLSGVLRMTPDQLSAAWREGKSLAELAEQQDVPIQEVKQVLRQIMLDKLERKEAEGMIAPSKAAKWKTEVDGYVEKMVTAKRSEKRG